MSAGGTRCGSQARGQIGGHGGGLGHAARLRNARGTRRDPVRSAPMTAADPTSPGAAAKPSHAEPPGGRGAGAAAPRHPGRVLPGPPRADRPLRRPPATAKRVPRVVRADLPARSRRVRVHLGADAHRARRRRLVRRGVRAAQRQRAEPRPAGRRGHGRHHAVPDARARRLRSRDHDHRDHRGRPDVDRHPVRAAGDRAPRPALRGDHQLPAAQRRAARWGHRRVRAHRRVDPARLRPHRARGRRRRRLVRRARAAPRTRPIRRSLSASSSRATSCAAR